MSLPPARLPTPITWASVEFWMMLTSRSVLMLTALGEEIEHGEVGVGLDGKTDPVRNGAQRIIATLHGIYCAGEEPQSEDA